MATTSFHPLSSVGQSTVGDLIHELRNHHPDQEVVLSTDSLPRGVARICVQDALAQAGVAASTLVRYCRYLDAEAARVAVDPQDDPAETPTVRFEPEQPIETRRAIIYPGVAVDGAVGGAAVLAGPWAAAVA